MLEVFVVALIALLAAISPGPDFAVVSRYALMGERSHAITVTLGIVIGLVIHSTYCILGLATFVTHTNWLYRGVRVLGAFYLVYLGLQSFRPLFPGSALSMTVDELVTISLTKSFREGFFVNLLNPKCAFFMMSIFSLVIKPAHVWWHQALFALEVILVTFLWFVFLSLVLTQASVQIKLQSVQCRLMKVMGVVLCVLGGCSLLELFWEVHWF